ncbi:unnamed protein product [Closterium sp. NIES-54]
MYPGLQLEYASHGLVFAGVFCSSSTYLVPLCSLEVLIRLRQVVSSPPTSCGTFVVGRAFSSRSRFGLPSAKWDAECRIGLVMEVARISMIHAAAPRFLWPFVVRYAAHKLNLWPHGPTPSGVSQVDPLPGTTPIEVAVSSGAAQGAACGGAASGGAEPGGAESEGAGSWGAELGGAEPAGVEPGGAESEGVEPGGAESKGAESGGAEPRGAASSGGPVGASPRLPPQQLREWLIRRAHLRSGATGAGGARDARDGAAGTGGVGDAGAGDPTEPGAAGAGGSCTSGARAGGAGVGGTGAGGAGAAGARAVDPGAGGAGGTVRLRPYFVPLLQQVLSVPSSTSLTPPLLCPPPNQSQLPLLSASPLPAPSPYTERSGGLTKHREPASCSISPVCTARRDPRSRPPPIHGTHAMALRPSSVPLPAPPESSLLEVPDLETDRARAASPTVARC